MPSLADLSAQWDRWLSSVAEAGGEVSPEAEMEWRDLVGLESDKLDAYGQVLDGLRAKVEATGAQIDRLTAKRTGLSRQIDWLKARLGDHLDVRGVKRAEGLIWHAGWRNNGGAPPILVSVPVEDIPVRYHKVTTEPDKELLRKALESKAEIPGVAFGERGRHIALW